MSRRMAHPISQPVTLRDAALFLVGLLGTLTFVVLFLAMGPA